MKRVLLLVSVALVMAVVAVMAAPAFATFHFDSKSKSQCNAGHGNGLEPPSMMIAILAVAGPPYSNTGRIARLFRVLERVGLSSGVGIDGYPEVEAYR
jgi:hypothetical protein